MIIKSLVIALSVVSAPLAVAQNVNAFKQKLARPQQVDSLTYAKNTVEVTEAQDVSQIVTAAASQVRPKVSGFRIVIFMSNAQNARQAALSAKDTFASEFPNQKSYLSYENPYFKVAVGNCLTQEEAIVLLNRVKSAYPKAFIMREELPLDAIK